MRNLKSMIHSLLSSAIIYALIFSPVSFNFKLNLPVIEKSAESYGIKRVPHEFNFGGGLAHATTATPAAAPTTSTPGGWSGDPCLESGSDPAVLAACSPTQDGIGEYIVWSLFNMMGVAGPFEFLLATSPSYWLFVGGSYYHVISDLIFQMKYNEWTKQLQNNELKDSAGTIYAFNKNYFTDNIFLVKKKDAEGKDNVNALGAGDQLSFAMKSLYGEKLKRMMLLNRRKVAKITSQFYLAAGIVSTIETLANFIIEYYRQVGLYTTGSCATGTLPAAIAACAAAAAAAGSWVSFVRIGSYSVESTVAGMIPVDPIVPHPMLSRMGAVKATLPPTYEPDCVKNAMFVTCSDWPACSPITPAGLAKAAGNGALAAGASSLKIAQGLITGSYNAPAAPPTTNVDRESINTGSIFKELSKMSNIFRSTKNMTDLFFVMDEDKRLKNNEVSSVSLDIYQKVKSVVGSEDLDPFSGTDNSDEGKNFFNSIADNIDMVKDISLIESAQADAAAVVPAVAAPAAAASPFDLCGGFTSCLKTGVLAIQGIFTSIAGGETQTQQNAWRDIWGMLSAFLGQLPIGWLLTNDLSRTAAFYTGAGMGNAISKGDATTCPEEIEHSWFATDLLMGGTGADAGLEKDNTKLPNCSGYVGDGAMSKRIKMIARNEGILLEYARKMHNLSDSAGLGQDGGVAGTRTITDSKSKITYKFTKASTTPPTIPIPNILTAGKSRVQSYTLPKEGSAFQSVIADSNAITSDAFNGNFGGASYLNASSTLNNRAAQLRKAADKAFDKLGKNEDKIKAKIREANRNMLLKTRAAIDSAVASIGGYDKVAAMGIGPGAAGVAGVSDSGDGVVTKVNVAGTKPSAGAAGGKSGLDYSKMFGEEEKVEEAKIAEKTLSQTMEEYDVGEQDITKNDKVSIWQVISNRYFKSYPKILEEMNAPVSVPLEPERKEEVVKP